MILAATTLAVNLAIGKFERVQGTTSLNREITELTYPSIDGRETKAVLSMPVGKGPFPLIVTVHGGNSEKPYGYLRTMAAPNRLSSIVNDMNNQPWAILAVSYRNGLMGVADDDVIAGIRFGAALDPMDGRPHNLYESRLHQTAIFKPQTIRSNPTDQSGVSTLQPNGSTTRLD